MAHSCCHSSQSWGDYVVTAVLAMLVYALYLYVLLPFLTIRRLWSQGVSGPSFRPILGQLLEVQKLRNLKAGLSEEESEKTSAIPFFDTYAATYGPLFSFCLGPHPRLCVLEPAIVRQVYVASNESFHKTRLLKNLRLFGDGLVTADGASWQRQRRLINPAFNHKEIKSMMGTMVECAAHAMAAWDRRLAGAPPAELDARACPPAELDARARPPAELDMHQELSQIALDIIGRTSFGADLGDEAPAGVIYSNLRSYFERTLRVGRTWGLIPGYRYLPTADNLAIKKSEATVRELMLGIVRRRRQLREEKRATAHSAAHSPAHALAAAASPSSAAAATTAAVPAGGVLSGTGPRMDLLELMLAAADNDSNDSKDSNDGDGCEGPAAAAAVEGGAAAGPAGDAPGGLQRRRAAGAALPAGVQAAQGPGQEQQGQGQGKGQQGQQQGRLSDRELMDECVTFLIAGHETTANLLTWCMLLLSRHPAWQERARAEVAEVCRADAGANAGSAGASSEASAEAGAGAGARAGQGVGLGQAGRGGRAEGEGEGGAKQPLLLPPIKYEHLVRMKTVGLILNETLRLYPPAAVIARRCVRPTQIHLGAGSPRPSSSSESGSGSGSDASAGGGTTGSGSGGGSVFIPEGIDVVIPIASIHRSRELWGADAGEFRPERFERGVSGACAHPLAFLPFSVGPRTCIGQNFAVAEAKVVLAMLLQRYSWRVAPGYRHHPSVELTLKPKYGLPVLLERLA